jgi:hypothetical protein
MTASAELIVSVVPAGTPSAIAFHLQTATIAADAQPGLVIAKSVVSTLGGVPFAGTLSVTGDPIFAINGMDIVLARALTTADEGTHSAMITASTATHALSVAFAV